MCSICLCFIDFCFQFSFETWSKEMCTICWALLIRFGFTTHSKLEWWMKLCASSSSSMAGELDKNGIEFYFRVQIHQFGAVTIYLRLNEWMNKRTNEKLKKKTLSTITNKFSSLKNASFEYYSVTIFVEYKTFISTSSSWTIFGSVVWVGFWVWVRYLYLTRRVVLKETKECIFRTIYI